jgi:hypothetical protein
MKSQLVKCNDCKYESIRWIQDNLYGRARTHPDEFRCSKCKGLVKVIGEEK